ncbi:MAG: UTP--glucose-1-phosphate uridylyltransferase [Promethearchaeota archaeon]
MAKRVVIPAAGLGTRLLSATKEQPKEMLPIFTRTATGQLRLKPLLQLVFEKLYDTGFREFCFIVGRGKRVVEDHFTPDDAFVDYLKSRNILEFAHELGEFYDKVRSSALIFANQHGPRGFGDAVYNARLFTGGEPFLVHAGDDLIISKNNSHLGRLANAYDEYDADAALLVEKVEDPTKYGVIAGKRVDPGIYRVDKIMEKPPIPPSNLASVAVYIFGPSIYQAIERTQPDRNGEVQLTDAIQQLIDQQCRVYAVELSKGEKRIDIGTPESYWTGLDATYSSMQRR